MSVQQSTAVRTVETPEVSVTPRTWIRKIHRGGQILEVCPEWCTATHANDQDGCLDDLVHATTAISMKVEMHIAGTDGPAAWPCMAVSIQQHPYSDNPAWRMPHAVFEPSPDDVVECLDVDGYAAIIRQGRAHLDRMEQELAKLINYRAGYQVQQAIAA